MFLKGNPPATPKPARAPAKKESPSVISAEFNLLGNIICDGMIDFDGRINGNIQCHTLVIRRNGNVNGEITADSVQVYGRVKGMIKAKNVSLFGGCVVEGVVLHQAITIADGAVIDGKMKRLDKQHGPADELMDEEEENSSGSSGNSPSTPPRMLEGFKLIAGKS